MTRPALIHPERDRRRIRWFGLSLSAALALAASLWGTADRVLIGIAAWSAALWLIVTRTPRSVATRRDGSFRVRHPFWTRILLPVLFPGPLVALPFGFGPSQLTRGDAVAAWILLGFAGSVFVVLLAGGHVTFEVRAEGVEMLMPWPPWRRRMTWESVVGIRQRNFRNVFQLVLVCTTGRAFRLGQQMDGIGQFAAQALHRLPPPVLDAQPGLRERLSVLAGRV